MADRPGPSLRVAVVLALAVVGLLETLALVQGFRSHRRLTTSAALAAGARVEAALPELRELLAPGGSAAWDAAARYALERGLASEVEIFDETGQAYLSLPAPPPVGHWPGPAELERARRDGMLVVARQSGTNARVLAYVPVVSGHDQLVLRLSVPAT